MSEPTVQHILQDKCNCKHIKFPKYFSTTIYFDGFHEFLQKNAALINTFRGFRRNLLKADCHEPTYHPRSSRIGRSQKQTAEDSVS